MGAYRPSEDKDGLANYLEQTPHLKDWDRPTAWLLGTQMISSLRQLILSTIHTGFDLRDWMTAEDGGVDVDEKFDGDEYWLDFVADTGDAPALVYCLSRAMQRPELEVEGCERKTLPRGRVLVLGGDSAYPVADMTAIRERWQAPLIWASRMNRDLYQDPAIDPKIRIFAIPGNHDYYDALDGFNRQFRAQATKDNEPSNKHGKPPPLRMPGYERTQQASYFALRLPFEWHLWGVDLGAHPDKDRPIDTRQQQYFNKLGVPEKLMVVTALPVAVHHAYDKKLVSPFEQLRLTTAFKKQGELEESHARLDLSGDVHLYERYWGTTAATKGDTLAGDTGPADESRKNYAAVASGLGGAFHHPNQVRHDHEAALRAKPLHSWPPEAVSKDRVGDVLTRPRKVFQAGSIGVVGAALGILFYVLSHARWGAGPGVLSVPALAWEGSYAAAGEMLVGFGRIFLFVVAIGVWVYGITVLRAWTREIHDRMFEPAPEHSIHARLDHLFGSGAPKSRRARFLRWTGANRRVMISVVLRFPIWLVYWLSIVDLVIVGWLLMRHPCHAGINFPAAILVGGLVAFPFVTNGRRAQRFAAFLPLGLVHAVAQLFTPQLWANATASLVVPVFLVAGYWCIRPLPALLFANRGRWLTPIWIVLVAVMLVAPIVVPYLSLTTWNGGYSVAALVWLVICLAGVLSARRWVKPNGWDLWRYGSLAAMLFLQVGALLALPYAHTWVGPHVEWWLGFAAAAIMGAIFACLWLGWYLVVCLQWGWHGNDAGSVARVDDYAEFLRIKLTKNGAEVWAIAVEADVKKPHARKPETFAGRAYLIDHFKVTAKGS